MKTILIVDDDRDIQAMLKANLSKLPYKIASAKNADEALNILADTEIDMILLDVKMPGMSGIDLLKIIRSKYFGIPVLMITGYADIKDAVFSIKTGALDYLEKPIDIDQLIETMNRLFTKETEKDSYDDETRMVQELADEAGIIFRSDAMKQVLSDIVSVAKSRATVLITGETGTGKELIADAIHIGSPRKENPFIKINCANINPNLLESELFGHEKGSFTGATTKMIGKFELADKGSILLDEIGEMPIELQSKLLRVLQEKKIDRIGGKKPIPVDVRIIASTNVNLDSAIQEGKFRQDLYYRLNVIEITLPTLVQRKNDILPLADHFIEKYSTSDQTISMTREFKDALMNHEWKGNIRELQHVIERATLLARGGRLLIEHLPPQFFDREDEGRNFDEKIVVESTEYEKTKNIATLDQGELALIKQALEKVGGHREKAAKLLGISRRALQYKLKKYGLI